MALRFKYLGPRSIFLTRDTFMFVHPVISFYFGLCNSRSGTSQMHNKKRQHNMLSFSRARQKDSLLCCPPMGTPWAPYGVPMGSPWGPHGVPMGFPWGHHLGTPWDPHGAPWGPWGVGPRKKTAYCAVFFRRPEKRQHIMLSFFALLGAERLICSGTTIAQLRVFVFFFLFCSFIIFRGQSLCDAESTGPDLSSLSRLP